MMSFATLSTAIRVLALLPIFYNIAPTADAFSIPVAPAIVKGARATHQPQPSCVSFRLHSTPDADAALEDSNDSGSEETTTNTGDGDDDAGVSDTNTGEDSVRVSTGTGLPGVNGQLMAALDRATRDQPVLFDVSSKYPEIIKLAASLEGTYILPLEKPSDWTLVYSTAPDLLGLAGGPLSELVGIQQSLGTDWTFTLTYQPSTGIQSLASNLWPDMADDLLTQTVVFTYDMPSNNQAELKLKETRLESTRLPVDLPTVPFLGGSVLPAVGVKTVFNDGDLRMDRTVQGDFLFIYQRV